MACPYAVGGFSESGIMCDLEKALHSAATIIWMCVVALLFYLTLF